MIRALRNSGIGQVFLGLIVLAIILAFVLTGAAPSASGGDDTCVVEVGDNTCVAPKEFEASYRLLSAIGGGSINEAAAKRLRLKEQVARGLAEREVLINEAQRLKIATSEDDVDQELLEGRTRISLPADGAEQLAMSLAMCVDGPNGCEPGTVGLRAIDVKRDGKFDIDLYKRTVRVWTRRSPNHFKEMQKREYTAERVRQLIKSQVRISEEEAFLAFARIKSKATARTVYAHQAWFERYLTELSDEDLKAFEKDNAEAITEAVKAMGDEGWKKDCPVVSEIRIDSANPGTEEAAEKRKLAEDLRLQLRARKNFAKLARLKSDAPSASLAGRVGCLDEGYGAGAAVLMEAAKTIKKPGDVSGIVETIRGFTILRLEATITEENRKELMRRHAAYKLAAAQAAEKQARKFAEQLIEKAQGTSLEEATKKLSYEALGLEWSEEANQDEDKHPALQAENAPQVVISRAVSADQDVVAEVKTEEAATFKLFELEEPDSIYEKPLAAEDGFVVLQLKSKELLTKETFEEDRVRIMTTIRKRKAEQALSQYVDELIKKAGGIRFNPKYVPPAGADDEEKDS